MYVKDESMVEVLDIVQGGRLIRDCPLHIFFIIETLPAILIRLVDVALEHTDRAPRSASESSSYVFKWAPRIRILSRCVKMHS